MSRFIGVVIDMIVGGAKETEKTLDSVGQKAGALQGAFNKAKSAVAGVGAAIGAAFGITKVIDTFINRTENAQRQLDAITESARKFSEATIQGFSVGGDEFDKQFQKISAASQAAVEAARASSESQLTDMWQVALRQVGLAPSREEIEKSFDEAGKIASRVLERSAAELEKRRAEQRLAAARKEDNRVFDERRQQELQLLADEAALQEDSEKKKIEIQIQFAKLRIELEKQLEKEKDDYLHKLLEARYELTFETERRQQQELIQERERLEKESAKRVAEAHAKAMEDAMAPILQRIETARTQTNTALLQSLSALNTNLQLFANSFKPGGSNAPARSIWQ